MYRGYGDSKAGITKLFALLFAAVFVLGGGLRLGAEGFEISGTLDSRLVGAAGAGAAPDFSLGFETWTNLRGQTRLRDYASVYVAVNLVAASGSIAENVVLATALSPAAPVPATAYTGGENFLAALELERLYFRVQGDWAQLDTGLMRLPLGYSLVWGPSDFLNPRSPLLPDARPRGILGSALSVFPTDTLRLQAFWAAPRDPLIAEGGGHVMGLSGEGHGDWASIQGVYAFESPQQGSWGIHRGALSLKADLALGLTADLLYTWDPQAWFDSPGDVQDGLAAAAGFDYSLLGGDLYLLGEYLYSGRSSSTARNMGLTGRHYLNALTRYRLNDYARLSLACTAALEDLSFLPALTGEYEPFQGMTLSLSCQVPLDRDLFSGDGNRGELGPERLGRHVQVSAKARLRF